MHPHKFMGYNIYEARELETGERKYFVPDIRMRRELGLDIRVVSYDKRRRTWALFIWANPEELEDTLLKVLDKFKINPFTERERIKVTPWFNVDNKRPGKVYVEGYHVIVIFNTNHTSERRSA
jgi:hypothetical protein